MSTTVKFLITMASISLSYQGCKAKPAASSVRNVDALGAGSSNNIVRNQMCTAHIPVDISFVDGTQVMGFPSLKAEDITAIKQSVAHVLGAAPKLQLDMFLIPHPGTPTPSGRVEIYSTFDQKLCVSSQTISTDKVPTACWAFSETGGFRAIRLFAPPSMSSLDLQKLVQSYVLVELAYMYDFHMSFLAKHPDSFTADVQTQITKYHDFKVALAKSIGGKPFVGSTDPKVTIRSKFQGDDEAFESFIMAEAMDSAFCSDQTDKDFENKFKEAHDLFWTSVADQNIGLSTKEVAQK